MNDTPRTSALLRAILDRDGQVGMVLNNAPEEWVKLGRELDRELAAVTTDLRAWKGNCERMCDQHGELSKELAAVTSELAEQKRLHCETIEQRTALTAERDKLDNDLTTLNSQYDSLVLERDRLLDAIQNGGLPHSCSDACQRPACVLRRERDRLAALNLRLTADLCREMERNEFREACARVNATLENTPL